MPSQALLPGAPDVAKRDNQMPVRINSNIYRDLRTVAAWRGLSVPDYLSQIVEPIIARALAEMAEELTKRQEIKKPKSK